MGSTALVLLVLAGLAFVLAGGVTWRVLRARSGADNELLSDGAVLILSDGIVQQASPAALALFGDCIGRPVSELLQDFIGPGAPAEIDAVARLEQTGEPLDRVVRTANGTAWELIGAPAGALIRLVLREARYLDERLRESGMRIRAAETALLARGREQEALHALVAEGPIIAWHRTAAGGIDWAAGRIRTRTGAVTPEQAVEMIVARTRVSRQPVIAGEPQKARIEIVVGEGAETVALHVVEIVRPDGSRIGFGTDAGSAAAAERTLARFVQTMTETFAHLTVGLAIFDRNQALALFNPALVQMWGVEPAWLARRPSLRDILDELRAIRRLPELEDFHAWRARLLRLFENTEAADYEELWHLGDGSNIRVLARPHPHGALAFTFDDVTERMRLEQRYRHSIDLRRATLDGLNEGIAVFGANGLLQFVNEAFHEIWGTDGASVYTAMHARQLIGLCEEIAFEPATWQKLHGYITGEENRRAWSARLETGSGRALTARFAPLPDGSTLAIFADVTEAEHVAETLVDRDATLELSEAALAALDGLIAGQAAPRGESDGQRDALHAADSDADARAVAAPGKSVPVGALRQAGAITACAPRSLAGRPEADMVATLEFVTAIAAPRAAAARVAFVVDPAGAPARVRLPSGRLGLIALELATDAITRSAPGATVTLRAEGAAERFALHAGSTAENPASRADGNDRLARLVAGQGGRVETARPAPDGSFRLVCRFDLRRPRPGAGTPTGMAGAFAGNVRELKPRGG